MLRQQSRPAAAFIDNLQRLPSGFEGCIASDRTGAIVARPAEHYLRLHLGCQSLPRPHIHGPRWNKRLCIPPSGLPRGVMALPPCGEMHGSVAHDLVQKWCGVPKSPRTKNHLARRYNRFRYDLLGKCRHPWVVHEISYPHARLVRESEIQRSVPPLAHERTG